ncbi:MAG: hypothetical protein HFE75_05770 [Firmicutes bacterium]|jgi:drug/metabolite transporter (DMT)-like permease|nr:hypothetical protein [Bacillota bacterium]
MSERAMAVPASALEAKEQMTKAFRKKGIMFAVASGMCYGLYTAFMTQGMGSGIWLDWYGGAVSTFATIYTLSALGAATNDVFSAVWALIIAAIKGKLSDFGRSIKTKPGAVMMLAAVIGGPFASTCYVLGLQMAGSIIVPIAALNAAVGAILGKLLFKQNLTGKMILGIVICFGAAVLIGSTAFGDGVDFSGGTVLGMFAGLFAAIGWGVEGAVAGYGTAMIDYEIGITIRQCTSGVANVIILVPLLSLIGGDGIGSGISLIGQAFSDSPSIIFFVISGFFAVPAFSFWYKGNSMCGAALGMACNGMYAFWGPLACYLVIGLFFGVDGYAIPWQGWVGAVIMILGIFVLALAQNAAAKKEAN